MGWNRPARPEVLDVVDRHGEARVGRLCRQRTCGFTQEHLRVAFRAQVDDEVARVYDVLQTERADRRSVRADGVHDAQVAVVFRRGPTKQVRMILWRLDSDELERGQWLAGRIYPERCDISPDGRLVIYFGMRRGDTSWTQPAGGRARLRCSIARTVGMRT